MKRERLILLLTVVLTGAAQGQNFKVDTFTTFPVDTNDQIHWQCSEGKSLTKENYPVIIINGKKFEQCSLQNVLFDTSANNISSVRILIPDNHRVKNYGRAGKNGVVIIETVVPIQWVSAKQLLKQKPVALSTCGKPTLFKLDGSFYGKGEQFYIQKELIKDITIKNNIVQYHLNTKYSCVVTVSLKTNLYQ